MALQLYGEPLPNNARIELKTEVKSKTKEKIIISVYKEYYENEKLINIVLIQDDTYRIMPDNTNKN